MVMFQVLNPDALLTLRLAAEGTSESGAQHRIVNCSDATNGNELILHIRNGQPHGQIVPLTLRQAAWEYQVVKSHGEPILLGDYLTANCERLIGDWPAGRNGDVSQVRRAIFQALLTPTGAETGDTHADLWLKAACRLLRLDALRTIQARSESPERFFRNLTSELESDRKLWQKPNGEAHEPSQAFQIPLKPASPTSGLLQELQKASQAVPHTAKTVMDEIPVWLPYLELALERFWTRVCQAGSLLQGVAGKNAVLTRVHARMFFANQDRATLSSGHWGMIATSGSSTTRIDLVLPLAIALPQRTSYIHIRLVGVGGEHNCSTRRSVAVFQEHVADTSWTVKEFLQEHVDWLEQLQAHWHQDGSKAFRSEMDILETLRDCPTLRWPGRSPSLNRAGSSIQDMHNRLVHDKRSRGDGRIKENTIPASVRLRPAPKPASFLDELRIAERHAMSAAAIGAEGRVELVPYLEMALASAWSRIAQQTELMQEILAEAVETRQDVEVTIKYNPGRADNAWRGVHAELSQKIKQESEKASQESRKDRPEVELKMILPFQVRPEAGSDPTWCESCVTIRAGGRLKYSNSFSSNLKNVLRLHWSDILWSLKVFFATRAMTFSTRTGPTFDDKESLAKWLPGDLSREAEGQLQYLVATWRRAGPPSVEGETEATVKQLIGRKLLQQVETRPPFRWSVLGQVIQWGQIFDVMCRLWDFGRVRDWSKTSGPTAPVAPAAAAHKSVPEQPAQKSLCVSACAPALLAEDMNLDSLRRYVASRFPDAPRVSDEYLAQSLLRALDPLRYRKIRDVDAGFSRGLPAVQRDLDSDTSGGRYRHAGEYLCVAIAFSDKEYRNRLGWTDKAQEAFRRFASEKHETYHNRQLVPDSTPTDARPRHTKAKASTSPARLKERILEILRSQGSLSGFYVHPNIPVRKMTNATKSCAVPPSDTILGLIDCTVFGSASDALVFGKHGFYYYNMGSNVPDPGRVVYSEFPEITFGTSWLNCITLGGDRYCNKAGSNIGRDKVIKMLNAIKWAVVECGQEVTKSPSSTTKDTNNPLPSALNRPWQQNLNVPTLVVGDPNVVSKDRNGKAMNLCLSGRTYMSSRLAIISTHKIGSNNIDRNVKNAIHETGHLLGLQDHHNKKANGKLCVMNQSGDPKDFDKVGFKFCPRCQKKLKKLWHGTDVSLRIVLALYDPRKVFEIRTIIYEITDAINEKAGFPFEVNVDIEKDVVWFGDIAEGIGGIHMPLQYGYELP